MASISEENGLAEREALFCFLLRCAEPVEALFIRPRVTSHLSPIARLLAQHVGAGVRAIALLTHRLPAELAEIPTALKILVRQRVLAIDAPVRLRRGVVGRVLLLHSLPPVIDAFGHPHLNPQRAHAAGFNDLICGQYAFGISAC
jgi:hypothetical protein